MVCSPRRLANDATVASLLERPGRWDEDLVKNRILWLANCEVEDVIVKFLICAWLIWFGRNNLLYEFRGSGKGSRVSKSCQPGAKVWTLLVSGSFKLNVDTTLDSDISRYGAGLVIRNDRGLIIVAAALSFNGNVPVDIAEAKAVLEGLLIAIDLVIFPLCIESDAYGVVGLCNEVNISNGDIDNVISEMVSLEVRYTDVSIVHISRDCNRLAHSLAKFAISNGCYCVWNVDALLVSQL
ncbi:hypothetical protein Dsin_001934 [Dipteronia sinensis]|uniref:RNase H type-1 domain-containing protein n=1 Tax=Dipteronia sinensis TaxID=43782 RepID=A0AAE0B4X5_9ROSI|nr:hypothetical protein Dsin_001934 [Dipteronia sinensis]